MSVGSQGRPSPSIELDDSNNVRNAGCVWIDDFIGNALTNRWNQTVAGGATITIGTSVSAGMVSLNTSATNGNNAQLDSGNDCLNIGYTLRGEMEWGGVWFNDLTNILARVGVYKDANNYAYAELNPSARGNSNWFCCVNKAGAGETAEDSGIAATTTVGDRAVIRLKANTANDSTEFYFGTLGSGNEIPSMSLIKTITQAPTFNGMPYAYVETEANEDKRLRIQYMRASQYRATV